LGSAAFCGASKNEGAVQAAFLVFSLRRATLCDAEQYPLHHPKARQKGDENTQPYMIHAIFHFNHSIKERKEKRDAQRKKKE